MGCCCRWEACISSWGHFLRHHSFEIGTLAGVRRLLENFPPIMKKILVISLLIFIAGCAEKQVPFDAPTLFSDAEENMRKENFEKARKEYQEIQEKSPDKSYDAALMLRIADTYFGDEKYDEALVEYQAFLNFHPVNKDAVYAQYQIAMCSFNQVTTIDRDPAPVRTALQEFQKLLRKYPGSMYEEQAAKNISICLDRLSEYELYVGRFYHKKGAYKAAVGRLDNLIRTYPGSSAEKEALYYDGLSYLALNERDRARTAFETLVKKYPSMKGSVGSYMDKLAKN
jgi:outer membrane protein assembly factor BamD